MVRGSEGRRSGGVAVECDHGFVDHDPVGGQGAAIPQRRVVGLTELEAVDEDHPRADVVAEPGVARRDLERHPVAGLEDPIRGDPDRLGEARVQSQALVVAVHRHHVLGPGQVEHQLHVLLIAVTGGVDRGVGGGDHPRADLEDAVDRLVD